MQHIKRFLRSQPVLVIAFLAAAVTAFFIPPDAAYLGYCNRTVLIELFALMTAVSGLREAGLFETAAQALLRHAGSVRRLGLIFMLLCFFSSMLVTNDVALLTFVPLTLLVFHELGWEQDASRSLTIILETAAANLGSTLTPIGNPQNLFLYDEFHLSAGDFLRTMLPPGVIGLVCLLLLTLLLPKETCTAAPKERPAIPKLRAGVFGGVFAVCLLAVFRVVPDWVCLIAAVAGALAADCRILGKVDYALLATFVCFFVFVGNIARIEAVSSFFSGILTGREVLVGALLSQGISNVPAAVMLSGFTTNGTGLLLGVNIGGFGTLIASLASLISFQIYRKESDARTGRYFLWFTLINFGLLAILLAYTLLMGGN